MEWDKSSLSVKEQFTHLLEKEQRKILKLSSSTTWKMPCLNSWKNHQLDMATSKDTSLPQQLKVETAIRLLIQQVHSKTFSRQSRPLTKLMTREISRSRPLIYISSMLKRLRQVTLMIMIEKVSQHLKSICSASSICMETMSPTYLQDKLMLRDFSTRSQQSKTMLATLEEVQLARR